MYKSSISSSSRCYCGNRIKYPTPTLSSTCNAVCSGNNAQNCGSGSTGYFTVYSLSKFKFFYVPLKSSRKIQDLEDDFEKKIKFKANVTRI
jgi:hypothetical protein